MADAEDAELEADAAFEVPIRNSFFVAKSSILDFHGYWSEAVTDVEGDITEVDNAITAAEAKIAELTESADSGDSDDDGDDGDQTDDDEDNSDDNGGSGNVLIRNSEPDGVDADGATSLTTFATIVVASVYTLAF